MSPLLTRVIREYRLLFLPLLIALVANVAVYAFVVRPRGVKAAGVADRAAVATASLRAAEREKNAAQNLVARKARADEALSAFFQKILPTTRDEARRMMDETLPALASDADVRWIKRASAVEEHDEARLGRLAVSMVLQGEYTDLRDFIYGVESTPHFIVLDDLILSESQPDEPLSLSLKMSTYFRKPHGR